VARNRDLAIAGIAALPDLTDSVEFERGGFWRRVAALLIDVIAISVLLQLIALALFPLTDGHVQFAGGISFGSHCNRLDAVPEGISIPADFGANSITDCENRLFGLRSSRTLSVARITGDGAVTRAVRVGYMLDAQGKPLRGLPLDIFTLPLLLVLRLMLDRGAGSPGRRICRLRLADARLGHCPPADPAVNRRYAALALPLLPGWLWSSYASLFPGPELIGNTVLLLCWIGTGIPALVAVLEAAVAMIRRRDAWYDRFARTAVLRLGEDRAAIPIAAPVAAPLVPVERDPIAAALEPATPFALPPPLPPEAPRSRNYFLRHWRGELSLPVSYWLNGILGGLLIGITVAVLAVITHRQGEARPLLWLFNLVAIWLLGTLLTLWQAVGVWRSAIRYRRSGKRFWGGLAQTVTLLGAAQYAYGFATVGAPQLAGIYEIVSGDAKVGPHQFHILAGGQTLDFAGGITFGVADEFEHFLAAMTNVRTVRLNSHGGRILEAQKMADIIKRRNLATFVAGDCLSACTIVFLGGSQRFMLPAARLGFHQPAFRGMTASDRSAAISTEVARLQRFGLSHDFAVKANTAAPSSMWYPDKDELLREHVVTRLVNPQQVAQSPADRPRVAAVPSVLDAQGNYTSNATPAARPPAALPAPGVASTLNPATSANSSSAPPPAKIPAELLKRLTTQPVKKPAATPAPPATAQQVPAEQK
jgi:hypothetical protein